MGTTYYNKSFSSAFKNVKDFFDNHLAKNLFVTSEGVNTLLRRSIVGNVVYTLSEHENKQEEGKTFKLISVILINKYQGEFGYKDMDESMGPFYYNCPLSMLKESTFESETAINWRKECLDYTIKKKTTLAKVKKLKSNMILGKKYKMVGNLGDVEFLRHYKSNKFVGKNSNGEIFAYRYSMLSDIEFNEQKVLKIA